MEAPRRPPSGSDLRRARCVRLPVRRRRRRTRSALPRPDRARARADRGAPCRGACCGGRDDLHGGDRDEPRGGALLGALHGRGRPVCRRRPLARHRAVLAGGNLGHDRLARGPCRPRRAPPVHANGRGRVPRDGAAAAERLHGWPPRVGMARRGVDRRGRRRDGGSGHAPSTRSRAEFGDAQALAFVEFFRALRAADRHPRRWLAPQLRHLFGSEQAERLLREGRW